jgi:hypothetical protein
MPTNEMLDTYKHRDKTFVDRFWINPENKQTPIISKFSMFCIQE